MGNVVEAAKTIATTSLALLDSAAGTDSDGELSYILLAALGTAVCYILLASLYIIES